MSHPNVRVGTILKMLNGLEVEVTFVHDYEPPDPSVGIFGGVLTVTCEDDRDYDMFDNGDVTFCCDMTGYVVGHGPELYPYYD